MTASNSLLYVVLAVVLWHFGSAIVITRQPFADVITHSQARILWKTDVAAMASIEYGLSSGSLNLEWKQRGDGKSTVRQV